MLLNGYPGSDPKCRFDIPCGALVVALGVACFRFSDVVLLTIDVGSIGQTVFWAILTLVIGKTAVAVIRYQETLREVLSELAVALVGWFVASIHLWLFDWLFLRKGRLERIVGKTDRARP